MFCRYCGNTIDDDSMFCEHCGKRVGSSNTNPSATSAEKVSSSATSGGKNEGDQVKKWYIVRKDNSGRSNKLDDIKADINKGLYSANDLLGPLTMEQLIPYVESGVLTTTTKVISQGMGEPVLAGYSELRSLFERLEKEDKARRESVSCQYAWMMATIPIVASCIMGWVTGSWIISTIIAVVLNCVFASLDGRELREAGVEMSDYIWLGFFLIPVYLFMRSAKVDKNYGYSVTWCVLFVLDLFI